MGDWRKVFGTAGALFGTNGKGLFRGLAAIAVAIGGFNAVTVWTRLHDTPQINPIAPVIWEGTSALTFVLFAGIAWCALKLAPLRPRPDLRLVATHAAAFALFACGHIGGYLLLREVIFGLAGSQHCCESLSTILRYELLKDLLGYLLAVAIFWTAEKLTVSSPQAAPEIATYDIRDGARLVRVRVDDILAVSSAGNYVEFVLRDGRRPLMRKPLSAMEAELAARGFVRTHRSWLVNAMQVTGLRPEGSGDYEIEVGALTVPLSRRFPDALAKLRAG